MKSVLSIIAVVFSLAFLSQSARADMPEPKPRPQNPNLEAGRKAVEAKDFKPALGHLTKAVKEMPNDADVHSLLGYSYRKLGQSDSAMEHYRTALKIDSNHRGAHEYLGELYLEIDQLPEAEKELQTLYKACPWFGRCEEHEDLKEAIEKYKAKKK